MDILHESGFLSAALRAIPIRMLARERFRLIRTSPSPSSQSAPRVDSAIGPFMALVEIVQRRDRVGRIEALQRACIEHPVPYERYLNAIGRR
jgi:hypothetical protein